MMNIVKELVENSIDAKSTSIKIELKDAGTRMVKITDNGIGMDRDDATLAFLDMLLVNVMICMTYSILNL